MILPYQNSKPRIHSTAFLAEHVIIIGNVVINARANIWFNAVVRGDVDRIEIGTDTNIQEAAILHVDHNFPCRVGNHVTVGHRVCLHGCTVEDRCLIGIGAIVLNGATIGTGSIIGAGSVVPEGKSIPPGVLALGVPAKVVRTLTSEEKAALITHAQHYVAHAQHYTSQNFRKYAFHD
jgi:carbonic anhydrase/acetyltransferase-like protein (isoleucine patch superfamily)